MNQFYTRNIPALFRVQFLSFLINAAKQYFGQILTTLPVPDKTRTGLEQAKWKTRSGWLFYTRNIATVFGVQFLSFSNTTAENAWTDFVDFSGPGHHCNRPRAGNIENRARMTLIWTWSIPTMFVVQFLLFPVNTT